MTLPFNPLRAAELARQAMEDDERVTAALTDNFAGMKSLYARACGITGPNERLWLWDVDEANAASNELHDNLVTLGVLRAIVPSRRAHHFISAPFNLVTLWAFPPKDGQVLPNVQLHKDNPTNLYIPDGAA